MRQYPTSVVIPLNHNPCGIVLRCQLRYQPCQFQTSYVSGKLRALQSRLQFQNLGNRVVPVTSAARRIYRN